MKQIQLSILENIADSYMKKKTVKEVGGIGQNSLRSKQMLD